MRRASPLVALSVAALWAEAAIAEPVPSLDLRGFRPPTDPNSGLYLEPTATPGSGNWNVGAWLSYAHRPVLLEDSDGNEVSAPVESQLSLDYVGALGLLDQLAIGVSIPTVVYQTGDDTGALLGGGALPATAIGDVGFDAKATLVAMEDLGGFGLAARGRVTTPTGDPRSYLGEGAVTGEMRLLAALRLPGISVGATAGAFIRGAKREYAGEEFGNGLPWGLGIAFEPRVLGWDRDGHFTWFAETRGAVALTPEFAAGPQSPVLGALSARYAAGDASILLGAELPITAAVGNPVVRPVVSLSWAPRFYDEDGDRLADDADDCQEIAEDKDGFEDSDGCPDFDNDFDGVPDEEDQCGAIAEDEDEFEDDDGCPDPDNDGDTISDDLDPCPNEAGPIGPGAVKAGCPNRDADGDGVGDGDRCETEREDKDGFQDDDGCPDPDDDGDGVLDGDDACPRVRGGARTDPTLNGCPSPDRDGDTLDDAEDRCPDQREDWDADTDEDGCPDDDSKKPAFQRKKPLVSFPVKNGEPALAWIAPPKLVAKNGSVEIDPKTIGSLHALAAALNEHPTWIVAVGVKPKDASPEALQVALNGAFVIAEHVRALTYRDSVAEVVGWSAVSDLPAARAGIGVLVLAPPGKP